MLLRHKEMGIFKGEIIKDDGKYLKIQLTGGKDGQYVPDKEWDKITVLKKNITEVK